MKKSYVFRLIDHHIAHDINPNELYPSVLSDEQVNFLIQQIDAEKIKIQARLKESVFRLYDFRHEQALVQKYHDALILLINSTYYYTHNSLSVQTNSLFVQEHLLAVLHDILLFFEAQFEAFLDSGQRVPITRLMILREEIETGIAPMNEKLASSGNSQELRNVLLVFWKEFIDKIDNKQPVSLLEANYHRQVIRDVETKYLTGLVCSSCPSLHELLVYWNLNSSESIRYFSHGLEMLIEEKTNPAERLDFLQFQLKTILQMAEIPGFVYDKAYPGIKVHFADYLLNEIEYLEKKSEGFVPLAEMKESSVKKQAMIKVMIDLSIDQIGLFLRAADELRIIIARSMRAVFKAVAPHLSTEAVANPSWDNMRSKSYVAESSDKEVIVDVLERIIKKIKGY